MTRSMQRIEKKREREREIEIGLEGVETTGLGN